MGFLIHTPVLKPIFYFEKGKRTKETWYYEMPYPDGVKSFNKGTPINIEDFDVLKNGGKIEKEMNLIGMFL